MGLYDQKAPAFSVSRGSIIRIPMVDMFVVDPYHDANAVSLRPGAFTSEFRKRL